MTVVGQPELFPSVPLREKTLSQARKDFREQLDQDHKAKCPVCDRPATIWRRSMNLPLVKALVAIYKEHKKEPRWIHLVTEFSYEVLGGEYGKLVYWDLIESQLGQKRDDGNPANGFYRITERGKAFVRGELKVRSPIFIFNDEVMEIQDDEVKEITIQEACGKRFNYNELLAGLG